MSQRQTILLRLLLLCPLAFSSSSHTGKCYTRGGLNPSSTTSQPQSINQEEKNQWTWVNKHIETRRSPMQPTPYR